ncbi:MAG TPA: hypothetical protein VM286_00075 [Candidatus Thermoplasmatota archaeon]|nr:hypothetical protein [Candidatus Thermoplasmatota archaeon]
MVRLLAVLALVFLAAAPLAQAAGLPGEARLLSATGQVDLEGHLVAWVLPASANAGELRVQAQRFDVWAHEWEHGVGPGNGAPAIKKQPHTAAVATASSWSDDSILQVYARPGSPPPTVRFSTASMRLAPDGRSCIRDPSEVQSAPSCYDASFGGAVQQPAGPTTVTITGSFKLKFWGWSGSLAAAERTGTLWSGHERNTVGFQRALTLDRWGLFNADAQDATLTVVLKEGDVGELVLGDAVLQVDGSTVLATPKGDLVHTTGVQTLAVDFPAGRMQVASQAPLVAPVSGSVLPLPGWPWLAGAAAVAALGTAGTLLVRRLARPRDPVLQALHAKDPIKAARLAAVGGPSRDADQAVVRAVAYMQAGELALAERELCAYALPAADLKFMTACLRLRQGRDGEARALLAETVALQPAYVAEIQLNPDLTRLLAAPPRPEGYS